MKRGGALKRSTPLARGVSLRRSPMRATPSKRDYSAALEKVRGEGKCRACGRSDVKLDAAHIVARSQVRPGVGEDALNVIPLCESCHAAQHRHALELLPHLRLDEQGFIAGLVGIARAYRITTHRNKVSLSAAGTNEA